jgi:hypothetical protein
MPTNIRDLLPPLQNIKKLDTENTASAAKLSGNEKASGQEKAGKCKGRECQSHTPEVVPCKAAQTKKYCSLCKNHGGAHTTHNTGKCKKCKVMVN